MLLAISLNMINGFTGMFSLGHVAFYGIGAYTAALYMNRFAPALYSGPYWAHAAAGALLAGLVAGLCGLVLGFPCLRLKGDYLAIATLAFAEVFRIFAESFRPDLLGGPTGLRMECDKMDPKWAFCVSLGLIALLALFARNLKRSATGRAFFAIRENEIAAQTLGMNIAFLKVEAFVLGAFFAGIAGALFSYSSYSIAPGNFDLMTTIMILLMVVLGGQGSVLGSIAGAIILSAVDPLVRYLPDFAARFTTSSAALQFLQGIKSTPEMIYALLLIVLIRLRPQGIFGMRG